MHENLLISAFWREDESNQQLLRLCKIQRILIFGRIQIGTVSLRKGMALLFEFFLFIDFKDSTELDLCEAIKHP